ncbi:Multimodular transpeptidase-transglycosylase [hydrothermal vent metagenome]|uniref:Penicillin-binding protein 1A n=1 Tax=hydrothermal vent metagenome TaxID=652676 RepID=A0A3B1BJE9_9ZZZZ
MRKKQGYDQGGEKRSFLKTLFLTVSVISLVAIMVGAGAGVYIYQKYSKGLPDVSSLTNYKPSLVTRIYDNSDELVAEYYIEKRILLPLDRIPVMLRLATIAVEDTAFYEHHGLNLEGIVRAFIANIKAGRVVQGGSSITQQVAKLLFLSPERTLDRKIREAILSILIDRKYTKNQILEIYLNHIYYGHGAYGVEAAALTYFGKHIDQLSLSETAMIVSLPKAPSNYSPYRHLERAMMRRNHALDRLVAINAITQRQKIEALKEPLKLAGLKKPTNKAPWFAEHVRRYLEKKYGADRLYRGGLTVRATLDLKLQRYADQAVRAGLEQTDKRLGYRGPLERLDMEAGEVPDWKKLNKKREKSADNLSMYDPGNKLRGLVLAVDKIKVDVGFENAKGSISIKNMNWAHPVNPARNALWVAKIKDATKVLKRGDIIEVKILKGEPAEDGALSLKLEQTPDVQGALLALDPRTGYVRAMVGGYDPAVTKFNRAIQALRQPGSSFKPIIYAAALDKGYTLASVIIDSPIIFNRAVTEFKGWKPVNFEKKFFGPTTLRTGITNSRNIVTIKLLDKIGVGYAASYARRFGIVSPLDANLTLALGASQVSLSEMVTAYGTLANGGVRMERIFIKSVENRNGDIIEKNEPFGAEAIPPSTAYLMANVMENVVKEGTARRIGRKMKRPIAGKTGTTNNYIDAWFIGYTPDMVCGVWVGKDNNKPMGKKETGSRTAIPVWMMFMDKALKSMPVTDFKPPSNVIFSRINKKTGALTMAKGKDVIFESFLDGTQPTNFAPRLGRASGKTKDYKKGL